MMNFNVKYHFSHALMHWLREEGALGEELERDSIIVACKKKAYSSSFPYFCVHSVWAVSSLYSHTPLDVHTPYWYPAL